MIISKISYFNFGEWFATEIR